MAKILFAEDDPLIRGEFRKIFAGHKVTLAVDGTSALMEFRAALKENEPFEMVITDFNMPKMTGEELALTLRRHAAGIPVLLFSSREIPPERVRQMGAVAFVHKAQGFAALLRVAETILRLHI